jgi:hypothetical protein
VLPTLSRTFQPGLQKNPAAEKKSNPLVNFTVLKAFALQKKQSLSMFIRKLKCIVFFTFPDLERIKGPKKFPMFGPFSALSVQNRQ